MGRSIGGLRFAWVSFVVLCQQLSGRPGIQATATHGRHALPYQRIAITQFALIIGGFAVQELGNPLAGLLVLVAVKTFADLRSHRKEHRLLAIPADKTEPNIR